MIERLRRLWQKFRGGDVIVADIGENVQGTAVGKNIIQIGSLSIPAVPLFLLSAVLGGLLLWAVWPEPKIEEMQGQFNIVVAQFGQIGPDGRVESSEDGEDLSRWMYESLREELEQAETGLVVDIWHDSRQDIGLDIGIMEGDTLEQRQAEAEKLAKSINAHLLIYGNLIISADKDVFVPEFYVTELTDMPDLVGTHQLGAAIPVNLPIDTLATSFQLNTKIQARARVLTLFTLGLVWESVDKAKALDFFRQAEQVGGWEADEGKEVLYLFIGREARLLWEQGEDREQEALDAFQQAVELNPEYGRAYVGLGNVYRSQAEGHYEALRSFLLAGESPLNSPAAAPLADEFLTTIDIAEDYYEQALDIGSNSAVDQVEVKAYLGLSSVYNRIGSFYTWIQDYDTAIQFFNQALAVNQNAWNAADPDDARHQGLAQFGIGRAYHQAAYVYQVQGLLENSEAAYELAMSAYDQCVNLATIKPEDWFLVELINDSCIPNLEAAQTALNDIGGAYP